MRNNTINHFESIKITEFSPDTSNTRKKKKPENKTMFEQQLGNTPDLLDLDSIKSPKRLDPYKVKNKKKKIFI